MNVYWRKRYWINNRKPLELTEQPVINVTVDEKVIEIVVEKPIELSEHPTDEKATETITEKPAESQEILVGLNDKQDNIEKPQSYWMYKGY